MGDSGVALGGETADGVTLYAKNSGRAGDECQPFVQYAEARHPPSARVQCTHLEIPQVAETYRVMGHSPWWVWGFEHGVNEHAVAIGNHSIYTKERVDEQAGLIGVDLVRLGLERGRTAREALEVIATLIEAHGQGGAADAPDGAGYHNSFLLADPSCAWLLETSNRRWVARRVSLRACSNHVSLGDDWEIASRDLESFARSRGWWRWAERLHVADAYRDPRVPAGIAEARHRRARELLEQARGRHDVASMQRLLRDHGTGEVPWMNDQAAPHDERFFTVCAHQEPMHCTTASMIAPVPERRRGGWPVWICFGTPCTGTFLPVYLDGVIPACLARSAEGRGTDASAWWAFKRLQDVAAADRDRHTPVLRGAWQTLEAQIESERREVEHAARAAALARENDRGAALLSDFMARAVDRALDLAARLRARLG